jgi:phenylpropionate dioxygenase-like ring-hydroxylating dioxygenase large terminal subunit
MGPWQRSNHCLAKNCNQEASLMKDALSPSAANRCPGHSYTDMLNADTRRVPDYLLAESGVPLSNDPIPVAAYVSEDFARLEREKMWPNVWLFAAREDELPQPGDTTVFDINDQSFLIVRQPDNSIKAFYNACLHRGRKLRTAPGNTAQLRCPFHGFTWANDGTLKDIPCSWDFTHLEGKDMRLPEARVELWQGFVMLTPNQDLPGFREWVGPAINHYDDFDLGNRYTAIWVSKRIPANWKAAADAFMEAWHTVTTHPQVLPFLGDANTRYDLYGDFINRAITPAATLSPHIKGKDQQYVIDKMQEFSSQGLRTYGASDDDGTHDLDDAFRARKVLAESNRKAFTDRYGYDYTDRSDAEMLDNFTYNIFPNFSPWIGCAPSLIYSWWPGETADWCTMDIRLLVPVKQGEERPRSVAKTVIPDDQPFSWAHHIIGEAMATVFDQDMANLPHVQTGMKASATGMLQLGAYQDSRVRHFHNTLMKYITGALPG